MGISKVLRSPLSKISKSVSSDLTRTCGSFPSIGPTFFASILLTFGSPSDRYMFGRSFTKQQTRMHKEHADAEPRRTASKPEQFQSQAARKETRGDCQNLGLRFR